MSYLTFMSARFYLYESEDDSRENRVRQREKEDPISCHGTVAMAVVLCTSLRYCM
jgi:hypothetical protein